MNIEFALAAPHGKSIKGEKLEEIRKSLPDSGIDWKVSVTGTLVTNVANGDQPYVLSEAMKCFSDNSVMAYLLPA